MNVSLPVRRENLSEKYRRDRPELEKEFLSFLESVRNFGLMVHERAKLYGSRDELHHKTYGKWESISWTRMSEVMDAVSAGLIEWGIKEEERVGIFSANRPEWHLADLGAIAIRIIDVPIYPTNTTAETGYIVKDAGIRVLFVSRQDQYDRAYPLFESCPSLEHIVVFHNGTKINTSDDRVMMWDDFLDMGWKVKHEDEIKRRQDRCHYTDKCTVIYTSGTTGEPKGAVHTHMSIMHNSWGVGYYPQAGHGPEDSSLCMLPLSHVLERSWIYGVMQIGARVYYCEDHTQVMDMMKEANTTLMNSAPRLYEKIHSTVMTGVKQAPYLKRAMFEWGTRVGAEAGDRRMRNMKLSPWLRLRFKLADKLVLHKIRDLFGKNMHHVNAGGAALNPEIAKFFYNCGIIICNGYGLTETAPVIAMNGVLCNKFGSVGPLAPLVDFRIDPETNEMQAKGPNVVKEYFNKPKATAEAFTDDGWFKTGDTGSMDEDGYVFITGRIKDLIITSGGKNISPQLIETLLIEDYFIEFVAVVGDGRNYLTALIVPVFNALEDWAGKNNIPFSSREELVQNKEVNDLFTEITTRRLKDLGRVEQIKKFTLLPREFSQETGEITPTMKVKRNVVSKLYAEQIDKMYES